MRRHGRLRRVIAPALAILALTACNGTDPQDPAVKIDDEWRELSDRPTIDQALADYTQLLRRLRGVMTETARIQPWTQFLPPGRASCGEALINYDVSENGETGSWEAPTIPESAWPQARAAVIAEAAKAGFTTVETVVDRPGNHTLAIQGPYGAILNLGVGKRTVVSIRSGCHLLPGATKPTATRAE